MSMRDHYRTKAAEFYARARIESDGMTRRQYESLVSIHVSRRKLTATRPSKSLRVTASQNLARSIIEVTARIATHVAYRRHGIAYFPARQAIKRVC